MPATPRKDVERLQKEVQDLKSQLAEAEQLLRENENALLRSGETDTQTLAKAQAEARESKRQLETMAAKLNEQAATIDNLTAELTAVDKAGKDWQTQVESLQRQLADQAATCSQFERKLAEAEDQLHQSEMLRSRFEKEAQAAAELQAQLETCQQQVETLQTTVREQAATINRQIVYVIICLFAVVCTVCGFLGVWYATGKF
jgi:chromosome segregation ATPase